MNGAVNAGEKMNGKGKNGCQRTIESAPELRGQGKKAPGRQIELTAQEAEELMRHDSYRRIRGVIKQTGYCST